MQEGVLLRLIEQILYHEISKVIGMGVFTIWTNFTKSWGWAFDHHVLMLVLLPVDWLRLSSPNPQDRTIFTIWTNFTKSWGWAFGHHVLMLVLLMLMQHLRFRLYSPSPQDRTAFTVMTNFTSPEELDYFHQKV